MKRTADAIHIDKLSPAKQRLFMVMLEKERARRKAAARSTLPQLSGDGPRPASLSQERLWFLQRLLPDSCSYNIPAAVRLMGPLDIPALENSLERVIERHQVLRARFQDVDDVLVQIVEPTEKIRVPRRDLGEVPEEERVRTIQHHALEQNTVPYDLESGPLLRSLLLRLGEDDHALVLNMHHTVTDGISVGLLVQEMAKTYAALREGKEPELPKLSVQYSDYAAWQRQEQTQEMIDQRLEYWGSLVENMPPMLQLPTDRPRQAVQGTDGARHFLRIAPQLETRLGVLAAQHRTTPFVTYLSVVQVLLYRYSGQPEFLLGTAISGRGKPELEPLIGFFIDTVVLSADLTGGPRFVDLLARVRESATGALGHQDIGFEHLVEAFQDERDLSRHPLFQVAFSLQVAPMKTMRSAGLDMEPIDIDSGTSRMDLEIVLWDLEAGLAGLMEYDTDLFDEATIVQLERHYQVLLRAVAANPETPIDELPLMSPEETTQVIADGYGGETPLPPGYSLDVPIHEWIARQAAQAPERTAIVAGERRWSYATLESRANQLARRLGEKGVGPEVIVAILLERSPELILSELAILKAGAAFVALDPGFPESRLDLLLGDSCAAVVITNSSHLSRLAHWQGQILCLDQEDLTTLDDGPVPVQVDPLHRAYMIYTSGSTGRPKGAEIGHAGLLNFVYWYRHLVGLTPEDRGTQIASPTFDASVMEIWPFLSTGCAIHIPDNETRTDPERLRDWFVDNEITVTVVTTLLTESLMFLDWPPECRLRLWVAGGEKLNHYPPETFPPKYYNVYGPAECAVASTVGLLEPRSESSDDKIEAAPPLGGPITGAELFIFDRQMRLVPDGVYGELWVAGASLGRGYLRNPARTAERFLPNRFGPPGSRFYRTGDLVRRNRQGQIEFLGRNDHQVKIRGIRIELGEIEAALHAHPALREAAVVVHGESMDDKQLLAYVVPANGHLEIGQLRADLTADLPSYMVPSLFVQLDQLPINTTGKLDRDALPKPEEHDIERDTAPFIAPRTPEEQTLAEVFAQVLGLDEVGVDDNFFDLGGQSLLATQVMSRVRKAFDVEMPLRVFFERSTVAGLAEALMETRGENTAPATVLPPLEPAPRNGLLPLSFAQERLWFLHQLIPELTAYNVPGLVRLSGTFDRRLLTRTFSEIVRRHEVLRTRYVATEDGTPTQVIDPPFEVVIPVVDLEGLAAAGREAQAIQLANRQVPRPFDLERDSILRPIVLRLAPTEHLLAVTVHHIGFDMWSRELFARELSTIYQAFSEGRPSPMPDPEIQYADFAHWQRQWMTEDFLAAQLDYWRQELEGADFVLRLPVDRPRASLQGFHGRRQRIVVDAATSRRVEDLGQSCRATPFVTLLAATAAFLGRVCQQDDLVIGTPVANRHREEVEGLMGFFVNTQVLRARMGDDPSFRALVERLRDVFAGAFTHQDVAIERLTQELQSDRDRHHQPLYQATFNFLENYVPEPLQLGDMTWTIDRRIYNGGVVTDFSLAAYVHEGCYNVVLDYSLDLFDDTTADRMLRQIRTLIVEATQDPDRHLGAFQSMSAAERHQLVAEWNDTTQLEEVPPLLHEMVAAQAAATPEAPALLWGDTRKSYGEMHAEARRLGHHLRTLGVGPETIVGVFLERTPELLVALLGILEAGGAYLPLDPTYPEERLQGMLDDSRALLTVTTGSLVDKRPEVLTGTTAVCRLDADADAIAAHGTEPLVTGTLPDHPAYVIYTSGSTGRPKGVVITHRAISANMQWVSGPYPLAPDDALLQKASVSFDTSVWEMFRPLTAGARLVLPPPQAHRDATGLVDAIRRHQVSGVVPVPSQLRLLLESPDLGDCSSLRRLYCGGEALTWDLVAQVQQHLDVEIYNLYGPTETTICTTHIPAEGPTARGNVSIGRPRTNVRVHVADRRGRLLPHRLPGELLIGGCGVARGYLRRPALTASVFVPDPWSQVPGERLYRTGDLVHHLPGGDVEFLGRIDDQIKLRGYRIELGEIEASLRDHPEVLEAAAALDGEGDRLRLVAFVKAADPGRETLQLELEDHLRRRLPEHMVPSTFALLDSLPRTLNGKLDRRALAARLPEIATAGPYTPPSTETEKIVAEIWADVLRQPRVGRHDNFFRQGGHSLLATQLIARVGAHFQLELSLPDFFEAPTLADLSQSIDVALWANEGLTPVLAQGESPAEDFEEVEI